MLGAIKAKFLSDFEIDLLPVLSQQRIAGMNELAMRETKLLHRLAEEKSRYYSMIIDHTDKEMKRGK